MVKAMNFFWQQENPNLPQKEFTTWQIILIILGALFVILTIIGMLSPEQYINEVATNFPDVPQL